MKPLSKHATAWSTDFFRMAWPWFCFFCGIYTVIITSSIYWHWAGILLSLAALGVWMRRMRRQTPAPVARRYPRSHGEGQGFETTLPSRFPGDSLLFGADRLVWKPSFETGNQAIDDQHRQLFRQCNDLIDRVAAGATAQAMASQFTELIAHVEQHFECEEAALADDFHPSFQHHRAAHQKLLAQARELQDHMRAGALDRQRLARFLSYDLVTKHVLTVDLPLERLEAKQVKAKTL